MSVLRTRVLQLYRRIWRVGQTWQATLQSETAQEREYIHREASRLFRRNMKIEDPVEIEECIREAEHRLEIALHYHNPYPRHINLPQHSLPPGQKRKLKGRERFVDQSTPSYYRSYKAEQEKT